MKSRNWKDSLTHANHRSQDKFDRKMTQLLKSNINFTPNPKNCKEPNAPSKTWKNQYPIKPLSGRKFSKAKKPQLRQGNNNSEKK